MRTPRDSSDHKILPSCGTTTSLMHATVCTCTTLVLTALSGCGKASSAQAESTARSTESNADFDRGATLSALSAATARAASCEKLEGPHGMFRIAVRYRNDGQVESATVEPPFGVSDDAKGHAVDGATRRVVTDKVRNCVEDTFRNASVPPFGGSPITVRKTFVIPNADGTIPPAIRESPPPQAGEVVPNPATPSPASSALRSQTGSGTCTINVNSLRSAPFFLDETPLGSTPKEGIVVTAGGHTLRFVNADGSAKSVPLSCAAGQTKTIAVRMN